MTVVLRGMTWEHARGYGSVVAAAAEYRAVRPDVEIRWEYRSLQAFADVPIERLAEQYDLMVIDHPHIPIAAETGALARLDGVGHDDELAVLADQSVGLSHRSYQHQGHQFALAADAAAQVSAYRPDLLDGPPTTWEEVFDLAEQGRVVWPAKPIDAFSSLVTIAATHGVDPMYATDDAGRARFLTEEEAAPALAIMRRLVELVPSEQLTWNPIQAADALAESNDFAYCPLLFGYSNYSREGFRTHRLRYVDIPRGPMGVAGSLLGGAGIAVSSVTAHPVEAIDHAFWLASADVQRGVYYGGGGQPGNAVAWDDDRTNADSLDFFRGTRATLEGAYLRPRQTGYMAIQDEGSPLVTAALEGKLSDTGLIAQLNQLTSRHLVPPVEGSRRRGAH
ncbi:MAG: extracellular solute-binding protein [Actinobacteria bacterium]|jgi:multiple sugar transport system substrate-binding protein|nr:extracellular solute-binding protein [Actinomycetota bacterium]